MNYANLHIHSRFSDGLLGVADLLAQIRAVEGLSWFALTDHDSMSGIEPMYRSLADLKENPKRPGFMAGLELSTEEKNSKIPIHLLAYYPRVNERNYKQKLQMAESIIGDYCKERCLERGIRDLDARVARAHELNLDGLADRFKTSEEIIAVLHQKAQAKNERFFSEHHKDDDVIRHPVPLTYQELVDAWPDLVPGGSLEKIKLYILRSDPEKKRRLAELFREHDGLAALEAARKANQLQGCLINFKRPPANLATPLDGLKMLKESGALCFLAHPAADKGQLSFAEFDEIVTRPLIEAGLDGIEVFYPYPNDIREKAVTHYQEIARKGRLLISGGTDYHGDGRTSLDEVRLSLAEVNKIVQVV
jgi:predicted metal-dependent phosphoesterase TrpH